MREGVPVTSIARTLLDLTPGSSRGQLEAAINTADKLDLISPEQLRADIDGFAGRLGVKTLRNVLDRRTFRFTASIGRAGPLTYGGRRGKFMFAIRGGFPVAPPKEGRGSGEDLSSWSIWTRSRRRAAV